MIDDMYEREKGGGIHVISWQTMVRYTSYLQSIQSLENEKRRLRLCRGRQFRCFSGTVPSPPYHPSPHPSTYRNARLRTHTIISLPVPREGKVGGCRQALVRRGAFHESSAKFLCARHALLRSHITPQRKKRGLALS